MAPSWPRMRPSPNSHAIAKLRAQLPAAVTPTPMSSRDASHGFSRSLCATVACAVKKSRSAGRDESRNDLWGIVPVARGLSWIDAWDARLLRCHACRNEAGRQPAGRPAQWRQQDRLLSVAAPPMKPARRGSNPRICDFTNRAAPPRHGLRERPQLLPALGPFSCSFPIWHRVNGGRCFDIEATIGKDLPRLRALARMTVMERFSETAATTADEPSSISSIRRVI
jgi:hypothetical protein